MSDTPLVRLINLRKGFSKGNEPISIFDGLNLAIPPEPVPLTGAARRPSCCGSPATVLTRGQRLVTHCGVRSKRKTCSIGVGGAWGDDKRLANRMWEPASK